MIIAINGKIGAGKDTVGKIIQYLTLGEEFAKTNADVVADLEYDGYCANKSKFEIKKFAGKLKTIASLLTGIPVEMFENQEFKQKHMGLQWKMTYREFLQKLGTEAMRDGLHTNVWVNALFADYHPTPNKSMDESFMEQFVTGSSTVRYQFPNWIITDMRFPNEMEAVEEKEGITIRVVRYPKTVEQSRGPENVETIPFDPTNQKHMDLWKGDSSRLHPSETALDDAKFDYEIINDGTIEDLIEKVRALLIKENII
jgi:hypothetical protein